MFYTGVTSNLEKRVYQHNHSNTKSTKPYAPWRVIYTESYADKQLVYKREFYLKSPNGYMEKSKIVQENQFV